MINLFFFFNKGMTPSEETIALLAEKAGKTIEDEFEFRDFAFCLAVLRESST